MRNLIFAALIGLLSICCIAGQTIQPNPDPDKARFITSDIDNFWRAFDLAAKEADREKRIEIFQREYLDKGSIGLKDFLRLRIKSAKTLTETVEKLPRFFASIRASTLRIKEMEKQMRQSFRKFKKIYPEAVFPDVFFVIGVTNTGGTASENGLLIGAELYGATANTPRDEFPDLYKNFLPEEKDPNQLRLKVNKLLDVSLKPVENIAPVVAHESCHFNQKYPKLDTLLARSIQEGTCDFIAKLTAGQPINPAQHVYGNQHESELWREFQAEMNGASTKNWMYNGLTSGARPPDLGYFMGYKISESYYKNARNKRQAIKDILEIKDFPEFFERSKYALKFTEN
ncbi:MAG: hypothetical protein M3209_09030 [Acidobacteriota bacterium]|nr:hypothetical protein [Acidobacteriota bacterium]